MYVDDDIIFSIQIRYAMLLRKRPFLSLNEMILFRLMFH